MFCAVQGTVPAVFQNQFKRVYAHILHVFVEVILVKNLSNSIKLNFKFRQEVQVSGTKF